MSSSSRREEEGLIFAQQANSPRYYPRFAISTMDSPNFTSQLLPPNELPGTVGAGYSAAIDALTPDPS